MNALRRLFGWLSRKMALYVVLVVAIGIATVLAPWAGQVIAGRTPAQVRAQVLEDTVRTLTAEREAAARALYANALAVPTAGVDALRRREMALREEREALAKAIAAARSAWMLALLDRDELLRSERRKLRVAVIDRELPAVIGARDLATRMAASGAADRLASARQATVERTVPRCNAAREAQRIFESHWRWRVRRWIDNAEHRALVATAQARCDEALAAIASRDRQLKVARAQARALVGAEYTYLAAVQATGAVRRANAGLVADAERARVELSGSAAEKLRLWAERVRLRALLGQAAVALAVIVAMPFLIRLLCYFVLAPLAMRRPAIRLRGGDLAGVAIPAAPVSATSIGVRLAPGEELLVRQDFLQTSSATSAKSTRWFLDATKPFTSIATGLTLLTRIRGDGEVTTVSAVRDGFAEVTVLTLPEGAACVLHPRALAAIAQPIARPLRVTSHWRLGSLHAWLTLQLRYLVFHGPARLVLKGGRGVRVERGARGRVFAQDQLIGFSTDLAYTVTRTETFWPYFLGREPLLKERVQGGDGMLIVEEAPLSGRDGAGRRGLEGMIDAGMKAFGM